MTTNETPYRPQIDDKVKFLVDTQYGIGLVTSIINDRCQVYCGGVWVIVESSQLELISRADGVPVEKSISPSAAQAESDEEIALQLANWLRADGPDDRELNLARAVWLEEIADNAEHYRRAGVPVGKAVDLQKENEELRTKLAALQRRTDRHDHAKDLGQAVEGDAVVMARITSERDELRKELAEAKSVLTNFSTWSDDQCSWNDAGVRARAIASAFLARHQPPSAVNTQQPHDDAGNRCAACGWTYAKSAKEGCVPGDCSLRPFPHPMRDEARYRSEQQSAVDTQQVKS